VHLLEVGFILESRAPGAVGLCRGLLGATLVRPSAALRRPFHAGHLLEVVGLKWARHFVAAASIRAVGGGSRAGVGPGLLVSLGASHIGFLSRK